MNFHNQCHHQIVDHSNCEHSDWLFQNMGTTTCKHGTDEPLQHYSWSGKHCKTCSKIIFATINGKPNENLTDREKFLLAPSREKLKREVVLALDQLSRCLKQLLEREQKGYTDTVGTEGE